MRFMLFIILLSLFTKNTKCSRQVQKESNSESDEVTYTYTYSTNEVNLRGSIRRTFAMEAALTDPSSNMVCSPISALFPLGKLALGANTWAQRELHEATGYSSKSQLKKRFRYIRNKLKNMRHVILDICSKIFVSDKEKIKTEFKEDVIKVFHSAVEKTNFNSPVRAATEINNMVKTETRGMISHIISPGDISPQSSLILVNAVYFEGEWQNPFEKAQLEKFHSPSSSRNILMMSQSGRFKHGTSDFLKSQIIQIPYKNGKTSFVIILPNDKNGLPSLLRELKRAPDLLDAALRRTSMKPVDLKMPKFKITTELDLKVVYEKVGLRKIFTGDSNLDGILKDRKVALSKAKQKVVIEVNETGTKAAAITGLDVINTSALKPVNFYANHPFLYYVISGKEQLFAGIFTNQ